MIVVEKRKRNVLKKLRDRRFFHEGVLNQKKNPNPSGKVQKV